MRVVIVAMPSKPFCLNPPTMDLPGRLVLNSKRRQNSKQDADSWLEPNKGSYLCRITQRKPSANQHSNYA